MERITHRNGVVSYTFDALAGLPVHAHVSTRHGGVSPEPWRSLNFSIKRGDTATRVAENRARFAAAAGADVDAIVACRQVHGTGIAVVDWADAGTVQDGSDGLITAATDLPLMLVFADCVPVLLYDRGHHALGVVHAGWRGTVNGAAAALLWAMQAAFDTAPAAVVAGIGPSIGPASYEVGAEVVALATAKLGGADAYFTFPRGEERNPHFDLWRANADQLIEAGVPADQIEIAGIDTAQHTDDFFSHRAERGQCGLFGMLAWLAARVNSGEHQTMVFRRGRRT